MARKRERKKTWFNILFEAIFIKLLLVIFSELIRVSRNKAA